MFAQWSTERFDPVICSKHLVDVVRVLSAEPMLLLTAAIAPRLESSPRPGLADGRIRPAGRMHHPIVMPIIFVLRPRHTYGRGELDRQAGKRANDRQHPVEGPMGFIVRERLRSTSCWNEVGRALLPTDIVFHEPRSRLR